MLNEYSGRCKACVLDFEQLILYSKKQAEEKKNQPDSIDPILLSPVTVSSFLEDFEKEGLVKLERTENRINTIIYPAYARAAVKHFYESIEVDTEKPFPNEENTGFFIPDAILQSIEVKQDFIEIISTKAPSGIIYLFNFSDGISQCGSPRYYQG